MEINLPVASTGDCNFCRQEVERQSQQMEDRLTHEANIATALQKTLLPATVPELDGLDIAVAYQAGAKESELGGDFYDVFDLGDGKAAIVLGDVCGKGLAAAAQVSTLRNMIRYALYSNQNLRDAVNALNRILVRHNVLSDFATTFIGIIDANNRGLEYVSCGHEPAIILRRGSSEKVELLLPTGPVLGIDGDTVIGSSHCVLDIGDSVIIYSDGLVESGSRRFELMGVARIIHAIRDLKTDLLADKLARRIYAASRKPGNGFTDDVCLLVAHVTSCNPKSSEQQG